MGADTRRISPLKALLDSSTLSNSERDGAGPRVGPPRHPIALWILANARWIWPLAVIVIVLTVTWSDLRSIEFRQVRDALSRVDSSWLIVAILATIVNFAVMGVYDVVCLRDAPVSRRERWWIGTLAFAWSNFLTLGPVAGPAVRFWLYRPLGVSFTSLRRAIVSIAVGFSSGLVLWIVFIHLPMPETWWGPFAKVGLAFAAAFLAGRLAGKVQMWKRFPGWVHEMNVNWSALLMLGGLDWLLTFLVFSACLRAAAVELGLDRLGRLYYLGQGVGVLSLIPGGLGSADAFWLASLGVVVGPAAAGLVLYRTIYSLLPWAVASVLLLRKAVHSKVRWAGPARWFVSLIVRLSGCLMLISAATPSLANRIRTLSRVVSMVVLESSHVASAIFGLFLFVLARGLKKGYRYAYRTAMALLIGGVVGSLLKGLDYEEAIILVLTAALLWTHAELFNLPSRAGGTAIAILAPITLAIFVFAAAGFASYSGSQFSGSIWLAFSHNFSYSPEAARFLRTLGALLLFGLLIAIYLIMRIPHRYVPPSREEVDRALALHEKLGRGTHALMVGDRDKSILFLQDKGFCLYRTIGRYMVVFADPTIEAGTERQCLAVIFQRATELDRTLVFHQISARWLPLLNDFGYSFFKLGEEAYLDLDQFSISEAKSDAMKLALSRFQSDGYRLQVLRPVEVPAHLPELKSISDAWLHGKRTRERQFSIGSFDAEYLSDFPCAIVTNREGKLIAFANLLLGPGQEVFSVDLMRYAPDSPSDIVDLFLFSLFAWGTERGFRSFYLGVAPVATALDVHQANVGERLANMLFQDGEHWYDFKNIRLSKQKYDPRWVPRYIAYPAFWMLPQVILNTAALVAGGWRNVIFPAERRV
jgi:phosphatidylglycerol lysyltransferase